MIRNTITVAVVCVAFALAQRWGAAFGGWLMAAVPIQSTLLVVLVTTRQGPQAGSTAAIGALIGATSQAAFASGYVVARTKWPLAAASATGAFMLATALAMLGRSGGNVVAYLAAALASRQVALRVIGIARRSPEPNRQRRLSTRRLVAQASLTAAVALALSRLAAVLGAGLAGTLATFPSGATALTVAAHTSDGPDGAVRVLHGLTIALLPFAVFFAELALLLERGLTLALTTASFSALALNAGTYWRLVRTNGPRQT